MGQLFFYFVCVSDSFCVVCKCLKMKRLLFSEKKNLFREKTEFAAK